MDVSCGCCGCCRFESKKQNLKMVPNLEKTLRLKLRVMGGG